MRLSLLSMCLAALLLPACGKDEKSGSTWLAHWRDVRVLPGSNQPGVARKGLMSNPPRRV